MPDQVTEALQKFDRHHQAVLGNSVNPEQIAWVRALIDLAHTEGIRDGIGQSLAAFNRVCAEQEVGHAVAGG